jgi:hypothetical protein
LLCKSLLGKILNQIGWQVCRMSGVKFSVSANKTDALFVRERINNNRNEKPTLLIVDAQSVKNRDTAGVKGYDAGKKDLE